MSTNEDVIEKLVTYLGRSRDIRAAVDDLATSMVQRDDAIRDEVSSMIRYFDEKAGGRIETLTVLGALMQMTLYTLTLIAEANAENFEHYDEQEMFEILRHAYAILICNAEPENKERLN